jgi:hypothetical protein
VGLGRGTGGCGRVGGCGGKAAAGRVWVWAGGGGALVARTAVARAAFVGALEARGAALATGVGKGGGGTGTGGDGVAADVAGSCGGGLAAAAMSEEGVP